MFASSAAMRQHAHEAFGTFEAFLSPFLRTSATPLGYDGGAGGTIPPDSYGGPGGTTPPDSDVGAWGDGWYAGRGRGAGAGVVCGGSEPKDLAEQLLRGGAAEGGGGGGR
eukprot:594397-Pyramimonas_sp.AAC.1